jgi:hypothetical protein
VSLFGANAIVACYALRHPDYVPQRWHIFIAYLFISWAACSVVLFGHQVRPRLANIGGSLCLLAWFISDKLISKRMAFSSSEVYNSYGACH